MFGSEQIERGEIIIGFNILVHYNLVHDNEFRKKKKNVTQKELERIMIQLKTRILSLVVTIIQVLTRTRYIIL